jgi:NodT family efflux transporter outer membrane factor (OMF) lipoprotein
MGNTRPPWALLAPALLVAACAVGPDYHRPEVHAPAQFIAAGGPAGPDTTPAPDLASWWYGLQDPVLDSLVERAVQANPDIEIALDRLQAARTYEAGLVSVMLPIGQASAGGGRGTGSDLARGRASQTLVSADNSHGLTQINELGGFDAVWVLDLFGRYRREIQAAHFDTAAAAAARSDVLVTVISDVTRAYVDLRGLQMQAAVLHSAVDAFEEATRVAQIRYQRGITNELDATLAARELATVQASLAPVEARVSSAQYTIAILLGEYPEQMAAELAMAAVVPDVPAAVASGVPVDLLRRRPDVQQAEWQLARATANIGVATAALFPTVALTASIGAQRQGLGTQPEIGQHVWSAGPAALWPLLDFGALDAQVEIANLNTHALLVNYRRTIENAVRDVDTAVVNLAGAREQLARLGDALVASQRAVTLANERYERGLTDYLNVVDAERAEYTLEVQYAGAQVAVAEQFVALYRSLGGGWESYQTLPPRYTPRPAIIAAFQRILSRDDPLKSP